MKRRTTIFDTESEHGIFKAVAGSWEPDVKVFPHVPFENLIEVDPSGWPTEIDKLLGLDPIVLGSTELEFLHKTTVDFALVEPDGRPMLAVEFDGPGHGFSSERGYVQVVPTSKEDPNRKWKFDLKLRVAASAGFPLFIVSYDEVGNVDQDTNLIVLHGIIGEWLASWNTHAIAQQLYDEQRGDIEALPEYAQEERIQDLVDGASVLAAMRWNPIVKRTAELQHIVYQLDHGVSASESGSPCVFDPPPPADVTPMTPAWLAYLANPRLRTGAAWVVKTRYGEASGHIALRGGFWNYGICMPTLAQEIAELLAWNGALQLLRSAVGG